jgi:trimeric autotransporter adhesin
MRQILFIALVLLSFHVRAADYYWVGGGGNWSDLNHWHLGSTSGPNPSIVPSSGDNVFFDANSGFGTTVASRTVTLNSNGFCNNMTWSNVPNSPIFNAANASLTVQVWGNLVFSPTTTYNAQFDFRGGTANTLTTGGTGLGAFTLNIDKPGGGLTVTDSLVCPGSVNIVLTSGIFNVAGKKLYVFTFASTNNNVRTFDISNSNATVTYQYHYTGANKTLNAIGSTLYATGYLFTDGGTYNKVYNDAFGSNNFGISNTVFSYLNFRAVNAGSYAGIDNNNTVLDSLVFAGRGSIGSANTVGNVIFGMNGSIGDGNTIDYVKVNRAFGASGTNAIDSLLLATNYPSTLNGTLNINNYLYLNGQSCDAFTEITGDSVNGAINFAAGAVADMNNMILTGVRAFGPNTPIAVTGIDNGNNVGFTITPPVATGTTLYWVGGAGDWNDHNHWSTTSGGAGGACIPFIADDVVFDANSGLASGIITTSSSSFCHDMTWTGVGTVTFNESAGSPFKMYGSLVMDNSVTMNSTLELWGATADSITTNGSTSGNLQFIIQKTGSGSITLADNWSNPTVGSIVHRSGGLNMSGRTVNIAYYSSATNAGRSVDISNAILTFTNRWDYRGAFKTIVSIGSHITAPIFVTDALSYPWVDVTSGSVASIISGTTFGQLTFTDTSITSTASIGSSNTIRRIEFKGKGSIGASNSMDTLLLAGSRNYGIGSSNTINKYFQAQATPCSGLTEIRGVGSLAFTSGATASLANVYMQNMTATGPITPIAFSGADAGGNAGWTINVAPGSPRYWIGGSGDWNDAAHWSTTSGGTGGACIPTVYDDVYFNANSGFTAASKTVTVNNGNAYCHNINWTGAANSPIWNKSASWTVEAWGDSIVTIPAATFNVSPLVLKGANTTYLQGSAPLGNFDINIDKPGGGLTLLNNYINTGTDFNVLNGAFNASGRTLNVASITNSNLVNVSGMDISNANITTLGWNYTNTATNHTLNATNSTINTNTFAATGLTYNKVNVAGTAGTHALLTGATIDSLVFTNPGTSSVVGINGASNTLNYVEYKGSGNVYGTGNTINTLVFFPGKIYTFTVGTTTNITNLWYASGTPCNLTEIVSSSTTANATINKTNGAPEFDYVRVRRITAAGSTPFIAFNHTIDQGNNINWNIAPYNGVAPIYGLGPDTAILASAFPYVLHTDGFFGNPSSLYLWNNSSTADSLVITDTGTYSVNVNFVDGCNISDSIHITLAVPLPVTLSSFSATLQNCQAHLNWKISDAVNFSHFVMERSKDGRGFEYIGEVSYANGANEYNYADKIIEKGTSYYRLKLVDKDGKYFYSTIESVQSDCEQQLIKVYPTLTKGTVYVSLPDGYEQATLSVFNILSQQLNLSAGDSSQKLRTIHLDGLSAGTYFLKVARGNTIESYKIVYKP